MDVTNPSMPDPERAGPDSNTGSEPRKRSKPPEPVERIPSIEPMKDEPVDGTRKLGLFKTAMIRLRHRHLTNRELWDLRVRFDSLIAANSWNLARNMDELNDRYPL